MSRLTIPISGAMGKKPLDTGLLHRKCVDEPVVLRGASLLKVAKEGNCLVVPANMFVQSRDSRCVPSTIDLAGAEKCPRRVYLLRVSAFVTWHNVVCVNFKSGVPEKTQVQGLRGPLPGFPTYASCWRDNDCTGNR